MNCELSPTRDVKAVVGQADRRRRRLTRAHLLIARSRGVCLENIVDFSFLSKKKNTNLYYQVVTCSPLKKKKKNSCVIVVIIIDVDRVDYVHRLSPEVDYDGH